MCSDEVGDVRGCYGALDDVREGRRRGGRRAVESALGGGKGAVLAMILLAVILFHAINLARAWDHDFLYMGLAVIDGSILT